MSIEIIQGNIGNGTMTLNTHISYKLMDNIIMTAPFTIEDGSGIIVDGNGYTITINNKPNFTGLFSKALTVKNLGVLPGTSTLAQQAGWFFAKGTSSAVPMGGSATNCYSTGDIGGRRRHLWQMVFRNYNELLQYWSN